MNLIDAVPVKSVAFRGTPEALLRGLRKCAMRGLILDSAEDLVKIQRVLDREARRSETMRVLQIKGGGIA